MGIVGSYLFSCVLVRSLIYRISCSALRKHRPVCRTFMWFQIMFVLHSSIVPCLISLLVLIPMGDNSNFLKKENKCF